MTVGLADVADRGAFVALLAPCGRTADFVGLESAELAKHALNAFLAASVALVNELARLCDAAGGDADAVERALRRDPRVGREGVSPGGRVLLRRHPGAGRAGPDRPRRNAVGGRAAAAGDPRQATTRTSAGSAGGSQALLGDSGERPVAAVLGLSYKPAAGTRARSSAAALCAWLRERDVGVRAHDPASGPSRASPPA